MKYIAQCITKFAICCILLVMCQDTQWASPPEAQCDTDSDCMQKFGGDGSPSSQSAPQDEE